MKKPKRYHRSSCVRRDVKPEEWIEIKYQGKMYLVAMTSLLTAYIERESHNG